jgi:hypothetical protein
MPAGRVGCPTTVPVTGTPTPGPSGEGSKALAPSIPSPLRGGMPAGRVGVAPNTVPVVGTPTPDPSPQGGGEKVGRPGQGRPDHIIGAPL